MHLTFRFLLSIIKIPLIISSNDVNTVTQLFTRSRMRGLSCMLPGLEFPNSVGQALRVDF